MPTTHNENLTVTSICAQIIKKKIIETRNTKRNTETQVNMGDEVISSWYRLNRRKNNEPNDLINKIDTLNQTQWTFQVHIKRIQNWPYIKPQKTNKFLKVKIM